MNAIENAAAIVTTSDANAIAGLTEVVANTSEIVIDAGSAVIEITAKEGMVTRIIGGVCKNAKNPYVLGAIAVTAVTGVGYLAYKKYKAKKAAA